MMINELLKKGLKYSLDNPSEFSQAYKEAFGESVCSYCPGIIQEKFNKLLNTKEDILMNIKTRKWNMVPGKLIDTLMSSTSPNGQYTNANITDVIAEQLIAKGYGKYFVANKSYVEPEVLEITIEEKTPDVQEEILEIEILEKETAPSDSFGTYSKSRLIKYCESKGFNKSEWVKLERKELIEYVRSK
jgi:hypothetical protein